MRSARPDGRPSRLLLPSRHPASSVPVPWCRVPRAERAPGRPAAPRASWGGGPPARPLCPRGRLTQHPGPRHVQGSPAALLRVAEQASRLAGAGLADPPHASSRSGIPKRATWALCPRLRATLGACREVACGRPSNSPSRLLAPLFLSHTCARAVPRWLIGVQADFRKTVPCRPRWEAAADAVHTYRRTGSRHGPRGRSRPGGSPPEMHAGAGRNARSAIAGALRPPVDAQQRPPLTPPVAAGPAAWARTTHLNP
jgi:hypothetical protein